MELAGYRLSAETVHRGDTLQITLFWRVLRPLDHDYQVFVHGDGDAQGSRRLHADHWPAHGYNTLDWQPNELIEDSFALPIPADYPFAQFTLWLGLYAGTQRLSVTPQADADSVDRMHGPTVQVL